MWTAIAFSCSDEFFDLHLYISEETDFKMQCPNHLPKNAKKQGVPKTVKSVMLEYFLSVLASISLMQRMALSQDDVTIR